MARVYKLYVTDIGGDVQTVDIYHTAVTSSNLIEANVTASRLTSGSGVEITVEDDVDKFIAHVGVSGSLCYLRTGSLEPNTDIDLRAAAKLLLLTAINAETPEKAFGAFRQQAESGSPGKRLTNEQLNSMLNQLKRKHEPIAHKLASGAGIELMYVDSQITERLIERFTRHYQCPILTIHDSYIVPFGYDRILRREMQAAFEAVTGVSQPVVEHTTEYYDVLEDEPDPRLANLMTDYPDWTPSKRLLKDYESFKVYKEKPDREPWVPDWTMVY